MQVALDEAKIMGLDDALEYITDDEQVEVTPQSIRIRKVRGWLGPCGWVDGREEGRGPSHG